MFSTSINASMGAVGTHTSYPYRSTSCTIMCYNRLVALISDLSLPRIFPKCSHNFLGFSRFWYSAIHLPSDFSNTLPKYLNLPITPDIWSPIEKNCLLHPPSLIQLWCESPVDGNYSLSITKK